MNNKKTLLVLFSLGAAGYSLLEILWRGYTHWSMAVAGGLCFTFFATLGEKLKNAHWFIKGLAGGAFITLTEFLFGVIFNILLKKKVWDYSKMPFNFLGQICLLYSLIWIVISIIFMPLACMVKKGLNKQ